MTIIITVAGLTVYVVHVYIMAALIAAESARVERAHLAVSR